MTTITAKSILASRHAQTGDRLDTLLLRYPRCIHAELMTHRVFSRNAASSRAIPVDKMIQSVLDDPFVPLHWGRNQKGMQATEETNAPVVLRAPPEEDSDGAFLFPTMEYIREGAWLAARDEAVRFARAFSHAGYHKQIVNRLLEPFMHITVLVSSTNWTNFLALRDHEDAEPHIRILAQRVREALDGAEVRVLEPGDWHLPFADTHDAVLPRDSLIKLSVACCASTSYKTVDGFDMTLERAFEIFDKLAGSVPLHASPFEHVAQADVLEEFSGMLHWTLPKLHGNFVGFKQYRKMIPGECQ